jgi:LPXTG-motif cell wall-anchored protein
MGAAALVVAPIALIVPSAQAETLTQPDDVVAHISGPSPTGTNHPAFWVNYLEEVRDITGAVCYNASGVSGDDEEYTLPAPEEGTMYVLAVTKAGAGDEANWVFYDPNEGDVVTAVEGKQISHVILCTVKEETPSTPSTPSTPTGPVVETDRVADTGSSSGLGLLAAGALIAAAGAVLFSRRRQGAHR